MALFLPRMNGDVHYLYITHVLNNKKFTKVLRDMDLNICKGDSVLVRLASHGSDRLCLLALYNRLERIKKVGGKIIVELDYSDDFSWMIVGIADKLVINDNSWVEVMLKSYRSQDEPPQAIKNILRKRWFNEGLLRKEEYEEIHDAGIVVLNSNMLVDRFIVGGE